MKLNNLITLANEFNYYSGILNSLEFKEWRNKCERAIKPLDNEFYNKFVKLTFSYTGVMFGCKNYTPDYSNDYKNGFHRDMNEAIAILETLKEDDISIIHNNDVKNKIFIVHGHDEVEKEKVKNLILKIGFVPIVISETSSNGKILIEAITEHICDAAYAVVLYTPCDVGGKNKDALKSRARQNVIFEHGYLVAKLGSENIFYLKKGEVEIPSDLQGMIYTDMDTAGAWRNNLIDNMKKTGFNIDKNKI